MEASGRNGDMALEELIRKGLSQGTAQVAAAGSPLHPFILDETGKMYVLFDPSGTRDPMELALRAIRERLSGIRRCALVIDTRITTTDGRKSDAILVMACERDAGTGESWAQCYVPKGFFRKFRTEGEPERIGDVRNFIRIALEQV